jgi:hypothetical protein
MTESISSGAGGGESRRGKENIRQGGGGGREEGRLPGWWVDGAGREGEWVERLGTRKQTSTVTERAGPS